MRICLITPPSPFELDQRVFPALGILKIGSVLEKAGYSVDHIDLSGVGNYEDAVRDYTREATIFAVTATTPQMPAAVRIATVLRETPGRKLILGGPHSTLVYSAHKRQKVRAEKPLRDLLERFDVVVAGDGEKAIFSAISPFCNRGVVDADDPKSPLWQTSADFTESPWPGRHLIDFNSYHYSIDGAAACHVIGQLGCPYMCTFCAGRNSAMLRRIRTRDYENVIAEVVDLHDRYGFTGFNFFDDELNVNKSMVDLMRGLRRESDRLGVEWKLRGFIKANLFNEEQAQVMYEAGFRWILIGFESGSERILANIEKKATRDDNTRCMEIAHRHGLKVKALMSLGHAGESEYTIRDTYEWLLETRPDELDATVITPYPGSPYWDEAEDRGSGMWRFTAAKTGDYLYMDDVDFTQTADYYKGIPGEYVSHVWTPMLSKGELVEQRDWLEREAKAKLGIRMLSAVPAMHFEHSMGMSPQILRSSK